MIPLGKSLSTQVGKKLVMSVSGIALVLFIIVHVLGNLTLYIKDGGATFNAYAHQLTSLGPALYVAEIGLLAVFVVHMAWAFMVTLGNKAARSQAYIAGAKSKGGNSHMNPASRNMIISGVVLMVFLVVHIYQFRIGKLTAQTTTVNGVEMADMYAIVNTTFASPINVLFYVGVMLFLGMHLSHGFWSAFVSLGAMSPKWTRQIHALGVVLAVLVAAAFLGIPIFMFLNQPAGA